MSSVTFHDLRSRSAPPPTPVRLSTVLRSEWVKLSTLRSTFVVLGVAGIGMVAVGGLASWAIEQHFSQLPPDELASFSAVTQSLTGVYLAQLAMAVLGVLLISGEYGTGMIKATIAAVPRRWPVLVAKLVCFAGVCLVVAAVSSFVSFFVGQAFLGPHGVGLGSPHALRAVLGAALYLTVVGALALGVGFAVRSTAGGIATTVGLLLVLPAIGHALPASWQRTVLPYLPSNAGGALYSLHPDPGTLAPWVGFGVLCAWAVAALAIGAYLLERRDA